jgi:hypothetical protein
MTMDYLEMVMALFIILHVADKHVIGDLMVHLGARWTRGPSSSNNSQKWMIKGSELGLLERCNGFFRLPGCRSNYKEHAKLLTWALAEILKFPSTEATIFREHSLPIGLRPDALIFLRKKSVGRVFYCEIVNNESQNYLNQKFNAFDSWSGSLPYLSNLFGGYKIPHYEYLVVGREHPKAITLDQIKEELCQTKSK